MLIVAMLAQTTTAVPAQRLLFPQHWLLVGWDIVSRCWLPVCSRWVGGAARAFAIDKGAAQPVQYNRQGICWHSTPQGRPEHAPKAGNAANQLASGCKTLAQDKKGRAPVFK